MKKLVISALLFGMFSNASIAQEEQIGLKANELVLTEASQLVTPALLEKQTELAVQVRMVDAVDEMNEKFNKELDDKISRQFANVAY